MDASVGEAQPGHSLSRRRQGAMGFKDFFGPEEAIGEAGWHWKIDPSRACFCLPLGHLQCRKAEVRRRGSDLAMCA